MRAPLLLIALGIASLLLGCATPPKEGSIKDFPSNNPTTTVNELVTGS